jgi:hypothetical protein
LSSAEARDDSRTANAAQVSLTSTLSYLSRDEAEATFASILRDEPDFEGELWVEAVRFQISRN